MSLRKVFEHPIRQSYRAGTLSKASLFLITSHLIPIIGALIISYASQGFWRKTNTYREQPEVRFLHNYVALVQLQGVSPSYIVASTYPALNLLEETNVRVAFVESGERDAHRDGRADQLTFSMHLPLHAGEHVVAAQLLLMFDYKLTLQSRFQMHTAAVIDEYSAGGSTSQLAVSGDLRLSQRAPLRHSGVDNRYNEPLVDGKSMKASSFRLQHILQRYYQRNVTTELRNAIAVWTPGLPSGKESTFRIEVRVNYVEESVEYYTGLWELLKWALVQYLAVFLPLHLVANKVREFVFRNRLVSTLVRRQQGLVAARGSE